MTVTTGQLGQAAATSAYEGRFVVRQRWASGAVVVYDVAHQRQSRAFDYDQYAVEPTVRRGDRTSIGSAAGLGDISFWGWKERFRSR